MNLAELKRRKINIENTLPNLEKYRLQIAVNYNLDAQYSIQKKVQVNRTQEVWATIFDTHEYLMALEFAILINKSRF